MRNLETVLVRILDKRKKKCGRLETPDVCSSFKKITDYVNNRKESFDIDREKRINL
jgi:hypothetical protein